MVRLYNYISIGTRDPLTGAVLLLLSCAKWSPAAAVAICQLVARPPGVRPPAACRVWRAQYLTLLHLTIHTRLLTFTPHLTMAKSKISWSTLPLQMWFLMALVFKIQGGGHNTLPVECSHVYDLPLKYVWETSRKINLRHCIVIVKK